MEQLTAVVKKVIKHSRDIAVIYFTLQDGTLLPYEAGQYITVFFAGSSAPQGKAYSLSSAPHEPFMSITVKKIGEFSCLLHALKPGDTFQISESYGNFNPRSTQPLVCLGAGVGIAPILSVLKDEYHKDCFRKAHLFYSNKAIQDIPHMAELAGLQQTTHLMLHHHITRQKHVQPNYALGRLCIDECLQKAEDEARFLVCGSVGFVRDMWRGLTEHGVAPGRISTETFFES